MAAALFHFREDQPITICENQINFAGVAAPPMGHDLERASRIFGDYGMFSGQSAK